MSGAEPLRSPHYRRIDGNVPIRLWQEKRPCSGSKRQRIKGRSPEMPIWEKKGRLCLGPADFFGAQKSGLRIPEARLKRTALIPYGFTMMVLVVATLPTMS